VRISPKLYRNRELFESGYTHIWMSEEILPNSIVLHFEDDVFYTLTPLQLYEEVGNHLNAMLGGEYFELVIIE